MSSVGGSYDRVHYLLRPSKQVERKLILHGLHRMKSATFPIYDYAYVGLGSVYFADFLLFHKYLYIDSMRCAEVKPIPRRMDFNNPYPFIAITMGEVSSIVPTLDRDTPHIVWLDYDSPLSISHLEDIDGFLQVLPQRSVLMVTVRAEPPRRRDEYGFDSGPDVPEFLDTMQSDFGSMLEERIALRDIAYNALPELLAKIIRSQAATSLVARGTIEWLQLFNFRYADGQQMLTVGGVIGDPSDREALESLGVYALPFVRTGSAPEGISVPQLTPREKLAIDHDQPQSEADLPFEMEGWLLRNYLKWQRHYPTYAESLL